MTYHETEAAMNVTEPLAGRFELVSPLARGTMGDVHSGRDLQTGDTVAVKLIWRRRTGEEVSLTEADKKAAKFMREVRIMSRQPEPAVDYHRRH
jgi:hypothetical protein